MKLVLVVVTLTAAVTVDCRVLQGPQPIITEGPLQWFDLKNNDDGQGYTGTLNDDDDQGYTGTLNDDDGQGYTGTLNDDDGLGYTGTVEFEMNNPHGVASDELYEGDIVLSEEQWAALRSRKATPYLSERWTEGSDGYPLVPYRFVSVMNQDIVRDGLEHWMEHTCIKFEPANNTNQPHLQFVIHYKGCSSYVGMWIGNGQPVKLTKWCNYKLRSIIHEVGHAIGFWHEQSRSDRDDYVTIIWENVNDTKAHNFNNSNPTNNYSVPYDYTSVMHYPQRAFNKGGKITIVTKDTRAQELIGKADRLSHRDKLLANKMYNCTGKWLSKCKLTSDPCLNDGYMKYNDRTGQCACVCPPGTRGSNCEESFADYYGFSKCNPSCFNGKCENGKCQCNTGYTGESCLDKETDCIDKHERCQSWANIDECWKNPDYMLTNCPRACYQCVDCIDKNELCQEWADNAECIKNPVYMLTNCPKACNLCGDCIDKNELCQEWADNTECIKNPDYMLTNCPKACNLCGGSGCIDRDADCQGKANGGWCKTHQVWMLAYCPKACNLCGSE